MIKVPNAGFTNLLFSSKESLQLSDVGDFRFDQFGLDGSVSRMKGNPSINPFSKSSQA